MAKNSSAIIYRIVLLLGALGIVAAAIWIGIQVLEPVRVPPAPPSKPAVTFDPKADIRSHNLWGTLQDFLQGIPQETGVVGNPNPFQSSGIAIGAGGVSRLASIEAISLQGGVVEDVTAGTEDGVLVLFSGTPQNSGVQYEIRSYAADGSATTFASWNDVLGLNTTPIALAQDFDGRVWLGNSAGGVGYVERDGVAVWQDAVVTGLQGPVQQIVVDGVNGVWVTDGIGLTKGDADGFTPIDLVQQLSSEQQEEMLNRIQTVKEANTDSDAPIQTIENVRQALQPKKLSVLADGRVGVVTDTAVFQFGLSMQSRPEFRNVLAVPAYPLALDPTGEIWGKTTGDGSLLKILATTTRLYSPPPLSPEQAVRNINLFAQDAQKLYAVDYVPGGTSVLW
ncbi:hypothetical protein GF380_06625, partial [Candidatus Uhrbacteria bacterium]|nr:hypothetical protein [Candidatus Uhrbacteria bacterium]MBD3284609.1 hypothetical protein [Candidatus Uhrbacteria bacterium]